MKKSFVEGSPKRSSPGSRRLYEGAGGGSRKNLNHKRVEYYKENQTEPNLFENVVDPI